MSQLSGSKPGSRNPIYNGNTAICNRWRINCNRDWLFFSTDEYLEVISTSLWGLREVTEENTQHSPDNGAFDGVGRGFFFVGGGGAPSGASNHIVRP
jgi:hypothetical protein